MAEKKHKVSQNEESLICISTMNAGKLVEDFDRMFKILILNALDPKTSHRTKRSLTMRSTFRPEEDRSWFTISTGNTYKLAGERASKVRGRCGVSKGAIKVLEDMSIDTDEPAPVHQESGYSEVVNYITLTNVANGGLLERWRHCLLQVIDNIMDPNTEATKARAIVTKVFFSMNDKDDRSMGIGYIDIQPTLAPYGPINFNLALSHVDYGKIGVREHRFEQQSLDINL